MLQPLKSPLVPWWLNKCSPSLCLPPLLTHKSFCFQEHFGRCIPKMLLHFAGAAAVRGKNDNPCGKQTEEFHLANRKDEGFNPPQEKLEAFFQYLFRDLTSGLVQFQIWHLNSTFFPDSGLSCGTYHPGLEMLCRDSCEIHPAGLSKHSKSRMHCLQQLQVSRERRHCWYPRLLKCFQSLSCARHHRIYSALVFSFLLKLTRNPPMSYARVNKLNKLTILFTFSETGSFCSCFNLLSLITQNKQNALWWGMDANTSLSTTFACNLLYFSPLLNYHPVPTVWWINDLSHQEDHHETCATFPCLLERKC